MSTPFTRALDTASWGTYHWRFFGVVSMNYVLNGVMFSIAPLIAYVVAPDIAPFIFAANLLSFTLGALILGRLADLYGRRIFFAVALAIEGIALVSLFPLYSNPLALAVLTSTMTFGIGGEFGAVYALVAELSPARHRGKALLLSTNFWNVGAAAIAGLALFFVAIYEDVALEVQYLLASALATLIVAGLARLTLPESPRWLAYKGRRDEVLTVVKRFATVEDISLETEQNAAQEVGLLEGLKRYKFRLLILIAITVSQYVTYNMIAYYAPYAPGFAFGLESIPLLVFVANAGASVGAPLVLPIIDRNRRAVVLAAFAGGLIGSLVLLATHAAAAFVPFFAALFVTLIFSEWAWGSLSVMQSELFPTGIRSSVIGLLTSLTGIAGAAIVASERLMNADLFLVISAVIWFIGLLAALAWRIRGVESARKALEELV